MQTKNSFIISILIFAIGILVGWLIWGTRAIPSGNHMMSGNMMMQNQNMNGMGNMMAGMTAKLNGKTGDMFDKAFIQEMILHHEGAVAMAQVALTNAKHTEIKTMANAIISAQTSEINQMKTWLQDWYRESYTESGTQ